MQRFDLKCQKTYDSLIRAFEELMREKTMDTLTVRELCHRASIGRNTFYSHFEDKYAFLQYYISLCKESVQQKTAYRKGDLIRHQAETGLEFFRFMNEHRYLWERNLSSPSSGLMLEMIKNNIKAPLMDELALLEERTGKKSAISKELLASFYAAGIIEIFMDHMYCERYTEEEIKMNMYRLCSVLFSPLFS